MQRPGDASQNASDPRNFELILEYIKALPVSCPCIDVVSHGLSYLRACYRLNPVFLCSIFFNISIWSFIRKCYLYFSCTYKHSFFFFLQTGQETDFILVSCSGSGIEPNRREQVLKAKKVEVLLCRTTWHLYVYLIQMFKDIDALLGWRRCTEEIRPWIYNCAPRSSAGTLLIHLLHE